MLTYSSLQDKRYLLLSSLQLSIPVILLLLVLLIVVYQYAFTLEEQRWQQRHIDKISALQILVQSHHIDAISDLILISRVPSLFSDTPESNVQLEARLTELALSHRIYYQLRFIDIQGMERVRINYRNGQIYTVPKEALQDKSHRDYFAASIHLEAGGVAISPLDLNMEHHAIEMPVSPVIRYATPVFDETGQRRGIFVLNYLAENLFSRISLYDRSSELNILLVNDKGGLLYTQNEDDKWGGYLPGRPYFSDLYGNWLEDGNLDGGVEINHRGLFSYLRVDTSADLISDDLANFLATNKLTLYPMEGPWKIICHTSDENYGANARELLMTAGGGLLLFSIAMVLFIYYWRIEHNQRQGLQVDNAAYIKVFEQSDEVIYITDPSATILYANDAVNRSYGYTPDELIGQKANIFKSGLLPDSFYHHMWRLITSGECFDGLFVNRAKDGSLVYELKTITPIFSSEGELVQYVSTGQDITSNQALREREMQVTSNIAGGLSHHFGNLLSVICGYSELTQASLKKQDFSALAQHIDEILTASERMEVLLRRIRALSGSAEHLMEYVDPQKLLQQILLQERSQLPQGVKIIENLQSCGVIKVNKSDLALVIHELVENAIEALPAQQGEIGLTLQEELLNDVTCNTCGKPLSGMYCMITIADNGSGIPPAIHELIWTPFYSTKESARMVGTTPGLGLALVRSIIHDHDAHLLMESHPQGTTIHLLFRLD